MWKKGMQRYSIIPSIRIQRILRSLREHKWKSSGFYEFVIHERGKKRQIQAVNNDERNVQRCLCDHCLIPMLEPGFIEDNTATRKGKGYHYAIRRVRKMLTRHIRRHGLKGYVLMFDFKNYFRSIDHALVKTIASDKIHDPELIHLIYHLIDCFGDVGLGLGSQISQTFSLAVGDKIDHAITETYRVNGYERYMDDGLIISESKAELRKCMDTIYRIADMLKLTVNKAKTRIVRMKHGFTFLKKRFTFTKTGKIIMKICRKSIQRERQKLRKLVRKAKDGMMTWKDVYQSFQSWRSYANHGNAHRTIRTMEAYYTKLVMEATE